MPQEIFEFDSFRVDGEKRQLWSGEEIVHIKPKTFDTLLVFLQNPNEIISKDELVEEIWHGLAVSDDSLTQQISQLRKLLGDTGNEHHYIITVPGVGYKFIADVRQNLADSNGNLKNSLPNPTRLTKKSNQNKRRITAIFLMALLAIATSAFILWQNYDAEKTTALGVKKIAVLPFRAVGEDDSLKSLKNGMTDSLITRLSKIEKLNVLPSITVANFEKSGKEPLEFGKQIKADAVIDGNLQKHGEQISVNIQMIRTADGKIIWSDVFQDSFTNVLEAQGMIAYKVAEALKLELSDEEERAVMKRYTKSAEAYRLYLDAKYLWMNREGGEGRVLAKKNYEQAIILDPKFALAYVGLANLLIQSPSQETYQKVKILAHQALEIDDSLGEAHEVLGFALWRGDWNWTEAERHINRAIELSPKDEDGYLTLSMLHFGKGKFSEAHKTLDNPYLTSTARLRVYKLAVYFFERNYDAAIEEANKILAEYPNSIGALSYLAPTYTEKGMHQEAIQTAEKYAAFDKMANVGALIYLCNAYIKAGQIEKGREVLQKILAKNAPDTAQIHGGLAMIYGNLGEKDKAFAELEKAIEKREWWAFTLKVAPYYDSLRSDERFKEMLRRVNLAQ